MDATRIEDGKLVYIKRVKTGDQESTILALLNTSSARADPRNHAVPLLDQFQDDVDPSISYIVMPFLRPLDWPPPERVQDCIELVTQFLEVRSFVTARSTTLKLFERVWCTNMRWG